VEIASKQTIIALFCAGVYTLLLVDAPAWGGGADAVTMNRIDRMRRENSNVSTATGLDVGLTSVSAKRTPSIILNIDKEKVAPDQTIALSITVNGITQPFDGYIVVQRIKTKKNYSFIKGGTVVRGFKAFRERIKLRRGTLDARIRLRIPPGVPGMEHYRIFAGAVAAGGTVKRRNLMGVSGRNFLVVYSSPLPTPIASPTPTPFPPATVTPSPSPTPPTVTIGMVCDARPRFCEEAATIGDLDQLAVRLVDGWKLDCVMTVGDMDYILPPGGDPNASSFDGAYAGSLLSKVPVFYTAGNHEQDTLSDQAVLREKYWTYPDWNLKPGPENCGQTTYSFDIGDVHVVVLNVYFDGADDFGGDGDVVDALFAWLKEDLRASAKPYKIVAGHEPAYPVMAHVGNSLDQYPQHRDRFWNLLKTERAIAYFQGHTHHHKIVEYAGVFEVDGGICGCSMPDGDGATLSYVHSDGDEFVIRSVHAANGRWEIPPEVLTRTRSDLSQQVLINTAEGAGTVCRYFVDGTGENPDWSENNHGKWWENDFDDTVAGWSTGELCVGYDTEDAWSWMNTEVAHNVYGVFQRIPFVVYDKEQYERLYLAVDYDDAVIVWLNGEEIYKSDANLLVGADDIWDKTATDTHGAGGDGACNPLYTTVDITEHIGKLHEGDNILSLGNWNCETGSHDLGAGLQLYLGK
jgi:hypothetical protein